MAKKDNTPEADTPSELFQTRAKLMGVSSSVDAGEVDALLLWHVLCVLAARKASIQIGVTQNGDSWAVQYWDGKVPVKEYFRSTKDMNWSWAALLRAAYKREAPPELEEILRAYGW